MFILAISLLDDMLMELHSLNKRQQMEKVIRHGLPGFHCCHCDNVKRGGGGSPFQSDAQAKGTSQWRIIETNSQAMKYQNVYTKVKQNESETRQLNCKSFET